MQVIQASVNEPLDSKDCLVAHAPDGKVFVTVNATEITALGRENNQMKTIAAKPCN
jgi:hypothetical protein